MIYIEGNSKEVLQKASELGIINLEDVERQLEMIERKEILQQHSFRIWQGKDGKWYTYIPDEGKGRKLIKRAAQKDLEDFLIKQYKIKDVPVTFNDSYYKWRQMQDQMVTPNTAVKYNTDYKRYFEKTPFSKLKMKSISEEDVKVFICNTVKSQQLCKKACKTLFGYISNVFYSAKINGVISKNPVKKLRAKDFYKYCTERPINKERKIVSQEEMELLYQQFKMDHEEKPNYIPTYAVELATLTGMRVGELAALTWDDVTKDYIIISKSEKYDRQARKYFIGDTKNHKPRIFPITDEIRAILNQVKKVEIQYGYICEWVFANEHGRIHAPMISSCSQNKCKQVGIDEKGIHAYRRTVNSMMRCNGVSATVAASLLGHTEEVNNNYYTFDVSDFEERKNIMSTVNKSIYIAG